ncbi:conserved Plasmodium protein, unknown function [Plasmodium gallinaceum]|uniref:Uncharacterized protein n=1 Tax=Plasmodium gallinaceum TaxID=5849 RepID=A0A1J1GX06_PLAGA|nr:conserved Plasmodium protein, unknown function [Plasmodium gallinaceum]CRG96792.1 conserved Plasmodium protein, unknown function [Plasmodium gallinaceum]
MWESKKEEIVNILFTMFLVLIQQISLLYIISNYTKNYHYFIFLVVDLFLCLYIVCSVYDNNNAGVKISIQWMIYMMTLSMKMIIFSFFIKDSRKYTNNNTFLLYLSNDVLVYNLIYMTPFIYLLFSLRSRNILENILDNKIINENILSVDVNIINLFDLIDLIFMYSHLTSIYKIVTDFEFYNFQNTYIMLIIVIVALVLFGFYFPIYTNIEKSYSYDETANLLIKKKNHKIYEGNNSSSENFYFSSNSVSTHPTKSHAKKNSYLFNKTNIKSFKENKITNFADPLDNNIKSNINKSFSTYTSIDTIETTFSSSDFSKNFSSKSLSTSSSYFSLSSSPSVSSYLSPFFSFTSKNYKNKMNKSDDRKYKDVYTDVYITAKFHFIIGFFLIDIPFFIYSYKNSLSNDFDDNLYLNDEENNNNNNSYNNQYNNIISKTTKNNKTLIPTKKEKREMKRNIRKKKRTFLDLIYKLKYKREMPVYSFKIKDHILSFYNFTCKRFNNANFVYFDDKLVFPYFTNLRFMLVILLDYFLKIGFTLFFIVILLNKHTVIHDKNLIYIHDIPLKNTSEKILTFPYSFDLMNYPNLELPTNSINIYYINKDMENDTKLRNKNNEPKGYIKLELLDNIFKLNWNEIYIVDKFCLCTCVAYLIINFLLLMRSSTFFDILYVSIFNVVRHLSFYFSLKQFILFFFMFNGNIYNRYYIYYEKNIRKLNYHFEYLFLLFFNIQHFISLIKHLSLFFRILFNFRYVYYYRQPKGSKENKKDELRYSVSVYILYLLCKYSYAPVNLNSLLFGNNILNNVILIDNINNFTWVNILSIILFKSVQILITKADYFLIGLFILHILLYIIYAIHTQILRYIILRKIEILFVFKHILISKYKGIQLVPDKNSPYVTCADILKYYSEEGFFSSESNMIPNFI